MPSTPKIEHWVGGAVLVGLVAAFIALGVFFPTPPERPRYLGAGNEKPRSGGTFVFHETDEVRTIDPHVAYDVLSTMATRLVFDGLLDYDRDSNLIPSLAEALPTTSDQGRVFRFRLRRGVRFHPMPGLPQGRELVAEDVRYSIEHLLHPDTRSPGYPFFKSIVGAKEFHEGKAAQIRGIAVLDRYTVEFRLNEPDQTFLNAMAMPFAYPVPKENVEHWGEDLDEHPVGTGPFIFDRWERGLELHFVRNPRYWRADKVGPDRMIYQENLKPTVAMLRFRSGDLDAVHSQTLPDYHFLKRSKAWQPFQEERPEATISGIAMNCELPPFDNVHFRRAVAYAIDRQGWSRAQAGRISPAGQVLPPMIPGHDPNLPSLQRFDLDKAREEMRLAGYPNGYPKEIAVWFGESEGSSLAGELLQQDLKRIGVNVRIRQVAFSTYLQETGKPKTVAAFMSGWIMDFPDPSNFLDILFNSRSIHPTSSENRAFYRNAELDRLLDQARVEVDRDRRLDFFRAANEIVSRDAPWAFVSNRLSLEAWQPYVKGYRPHPIWPQEYRDVWLDLPRRAAARASSRDRALSPVAAFLQARRGSL